MLVPFGNELTLFFNFGFSPSLFPCFLFVLQEIEDQGSLSSHEGFVCREGCVFSLSPRPGVSVGKHGGKYCSSNLA